MSGPHAVHYSGNLVIILTVGLGVYDVDYAFDSKLIAVCLCASDMVCAALFITS